MFEQSITIEICGIIQEFMKKHLIATKCGSEYIYQNDEAQIDALKMAADIADVFASRYEEEEF